MPAPNPITTSFKAYLRSKFSMPTKEPWVCVGKDSEGNQFTLNIPHKAVQEAMRKMSLTDPMLYRMLEAVWRTARTWDDIAAAYYVDPSTVRRRVDRAIQIVFGWILYPDLCADKELPPIDLLLRDNYKPGDTCSEIIERYRLEKQKEAKLLLPVKVESILAPAKVKRQNTTRRSKVVPQEARAHGV
jgi:hypothetical protein